MIAADTPGPVDARSDHPGGTPAFLTRAGSRARRLLSSETGSAGLMLVALLVALAWANSPWSESYRSLWSSVATLSVADWGLSMPLGQWVNDGLMALFFFMIGLEVRREFSIGALTTPRRAAIPVIAAVGGLVVPAALYVLLAPADAKGAWGVVIGTDTAVMLGALAVVGPRLATQLRVFLLTLTVIDDIVAVGVIGVFYSDSLDAVGLVLVAVFATVVGLLSRYGVWRAAPYLLAGLGLWLATLQSGLHASIAGMLGGLLVAAHHPRPKAVKRAADRFRAFHESPNVDIGRSAHRELVRAVSVNERMQRRLHPWGNLVVVPLFVLANAGVDLRGGVLADALTSRLTWAVTLALVVGKLVGILLAAWAGVRSRIGNLPPGVDLGHVAGGAALSGIGFTVSLLVAGLAFPDRASHDRAVVGILLAAVIATAAGWAVFRAAAARRHRTALPSESLDDRDVRLAAALAHGLQPVAAAGALELVEQGRHQPGSGRADRVPESDRAAVDVDPLVRGAGLLHPGQHDRRERLVALEQVDVVDREPGALQRVPRGPDRAGQHPDRVVAAHREVMDPGPGREAVVAHRLLGGDQQRRGGVADLGGHRGGDPAARHERLERRHLL